MNPLSKLQLSWSAWLFPASCNPTSPTHPSTQCACHCSQWSWMHFLYHRCFQVLQAKSLQFAVWWALPHFLSWKLNFLVLVICGHQFLGEFVINQVNLRNWLVFLQVYLRERLFAKQLDDGFLKLEINCHFTFLVEMHLVIQLLLQVLYGGRE